jgi:hypothetical protein
MDSLSNHIQIHLHVGQYKGTNSNESPPPTEKVIPLNAMGIIRDVLRSIGHAIIAPPIAIHTS